MSHDERRACALCGDDHDDRDCPLRERVEQDEYRRGVARPRR